MDIYDEDHLRQFLDIFPELEKDEVLFVSLSSRTKYLTAEQKKKGIVINRNEMFHRRWFSGDKEKLFSSLTKYIAGVKCASDVVNDLEVDDYLLDFTTSSGHPIPLNTVTVYVNINPSSMMKAASNLGSEMMKKMMSTDYEWFIRLQSKLNTEVQKAKSRRELIDIDFDVSDFSSVEYFLKYVKGTPIQTHSGYHVLIKKDDLDGINLGKIVSETQGKFDNKEIIINSNAMIPLPGTYSGGKEITFVD